MAFELLIAGIVIVVLILLASAIKVVKEYERGVIFRLGRLVGPGLFFIIPIFETMVKIDLRVSVFDVPPQEVITKDNVTTRVNAVVYYRVLDPEKAVTAVERYDYATSQIATTIRGVIGQAELDELLSERDKLNQRLQKIIDEATDPISGGDKRRGTAKRDATRYGGTGRSGKGQKSENHLRRCGIPGSEEDRRSGRCTRNAEGRDVHQSIADDKRGYGGEGYYCYHSVPDRNARSFRLPNREEDRKHVKR